MSVRPVLRGLRLAPASAPARAISFFGWGSNKKDAAAPTPETAPSAQRSITDMLKSSSPTAATAKAAEAAPVRGTLAETSIFGDETADLPESLTSNIDLIANREFRDQFRHQWGFPRRSALRENRKRGRLSRPETIAQTEKEMLVKSEQMKTSLKKMTMIARQIAGKPIEDAMVQLRFSKKAIAKPVLAHLKMARDEALVRQDMELKEMYVDQAWVGRGLHRNSMNHRAKGRIDTLRHQYTSISVVLKEKKTLERIAKEKEAKRLRKPVRQHLPSRPINGQRQYYTW